MNLSFKSASLAVIGIFIASTAHSSLVLSIAGSDFRKNNGTLVDAGTLFQLVNLGPNGTFDPINIGDGSTTGLSQWVSGDDAVIDLALIGSDSATFPSSKAFDLQEGADTAGVLNRVFEFASSAFPQNTNIGIRWFPGLAATAFDSLTLQSGQSYGQFTRSTPIYPQTSAWNILGATDGNITFDPLLTTNQGGSDATSLGQANFTVSAVPEPASIGLSLTAMIGLTALRRRRA